MSDRRTLFRQHPAEHESTRPWSASALKPRAWHTSDARTLSLDGADWRFRLSPSVLPVDFVARDFDDSDWAELPVPSHWVLLGHGKPIYTNLEYPFIVDPPRVPTNNPTGDYRHRFTVPINWDREGKVIIRFDGVESWFKLWLNGTEVGWSSGSRLPVEFDIGDLLEPENLVCVRVIQWSSGTYLEDQDQWWLPGIFRSVTLLHRPIGCVKDHFVHSAYDSISGRGTLKVDCETDGNARVIVPELDIDLPAGTEVVIPVSPWTAETPRLYRGTLLAEGEQIPLRIGFRTVEISDGLFRVNGQAILFNGINRHEFDCENGRTVDRHTMLKDVLMMKRHNFNAVRTAHYPPDPYFLDLCDEYGLWVIDEGDYETHGFGMVQWRNNPTASAEWTEALLNRTSRLIERDKNHPSVVLWSIGNEAGRGLNIGRMADWVRRRDPSRPVHYENDWTAAHSDIWTHMYTWHEEVERIGRGEEVFDGYGYQKGEVSGLTARDRELWESKRKEKPFVLVEYGHAMGNGPGGIREYQELFEKYPRLQGGFIWEWIDHGLKQVDANGMSFFAYGGDFGEPRGTHGGNFVCDGLLFPDRTPSPALYDIKAIIQPVVFATSGDKLSIQSKYDFRDLSHLKFTWKLERLGLAIADGEFDIPLVTPHETVVVDLPSALTTAAQEDTWWTVSAVTRGELWAEDGHEVAWAQYMLPHEQVTPSSQPEPEPTIVGERIIVGPASFDLKTGDMMTLGSIGAREARVDLWRAPTDNDSGGEMDADWPELRTSNLDRWLDAGLDRVQHHVDSMDLDSGRLVVRSRIGPAVLDRYLDTVTTYESLNGGLSLQVELSINPVGPWTGFALPRLGFCLVLDTATLSNVKWFGLGPGESYPDTKSGVRMGVHEQSVDDMQTPYVMPQENGNRMGVRFAEILDSAGAGLRIDGRPDFNFTVRRWTSEDLHKARRLTDLKAREVLVLNIDIVNSGVGSASTGPGVLDKHRLLLQEGEPVTFTFVLRPVEQV